MTPDVSSAVFLTLKIIFLVGIGVYIVFAGVMVRQEQLMADVLEESFEPVLKILVTVHFIASLVIFLLGLILL